MFGILVSVGWAQAPSSVPSHLAFARDLVEHVERPDNHYVLGGRFISFPGDSPTAGDAVRADCSGFLLAVFARAAYPTQSRMAYLTPGPKRKRPAAEDFVHSIENGRGFDRILSVAEIRPGDLIAHAMINPEDQQETSTTGHVFLVDSVPKSIFARPPYVAGTKQVLVAVIDSNNELLGDDDTRRSGKRDMSPGLGRASIRLYVDDQGAVVAWAGTFKAARYFSYDPRFPSDTKLRKAAIGRPQAS